MGSAFLTRAAQSPGMLLNSTATQDTIKNHHLSQAANVLTAALELWLTVVTATCHVALFLSLQDFLGHKKKRC